jgi:uncharacterized protein (TIGR02246 family)
LDLHRHYDQQNPVHAAGDEAEIRSLVEEYTKAVREGDLEKIMSFYAPDMVAYDMPPPLEVTTRSEYREIWNKYFISAFQFPVVYDNHGLEVYVSGDIAFAYEIIHFSGTFKKTGEREESWLRHTSGFKKIGGVWKIVHDHNSTPVGDDGKAMMNLKPEKGLHH